jgi:hypothetical protein
MVRAGLHEESLEVVCWRPRLALNTAPGGRDVLHVRVIRLLIIVVGRDSYPVRAPLSPLLASLGALDNDARWHRFAATRDHSLPPRMGRGPIVSLLITCWAAMPSCSSVVYQTMSFDARKGDDCCVSRMPLVDTFCPGPIGPWQCPFMSLSLSWRRF